MSDYVPREVAGLWYPVPCPDDLSPALGFPTADSCEAFMAGFLRVDEAREEWELDLESRLEEASDAGYDLGHDTGYEEGFEAGEKSALARSAESA